MAKNVNSLTFSPVKLISLLFLSLKVDLNPNQHQQGEGRSEEKTREKDIPLLHICVVVLGLMTIGVLITIMKLLRRTESVAE